MEKLTTKVFVFGFDEANIWQTLPRWVLSRLEWSFSLQVLRLCVSPLAPWGNPICKCVFLAHWRALDSRTRKTASSIFSHSSTLSAPKPASFWREKRGTIVILVRGFLKKCCRVKTSQVNTIAVLAFFDLQGSDTSYKDNWATHSADKLKNTD